ncbi:MAG: hypothetical protein WD317_09900 [Balneolaceae bacterium]
MTWKQFAWIIPLTVIILLALLFFLGDWQYTYKPSASDILNPERTNTGQAYDVWGQSVTHRQADSLMQTEDGRRLLSEANGAIRIDDDLLESGRDTFYEETFNNEVFFTDILGAMDGPLTFGAVTKALAGLRGRGTDNLQVRAARDAVIGGRVINEDDIIDTGLDVAKGAYIPMGMKIRFKRGKPMMGISCAACHSTYDPESEMIIEGAPNSNLNPGLLLALGSNSAAFLANTDIAALDRFISENSREITGSDGQMHLLPDPELLENAVDSALVRWPPGSFDSSNETRATPSQIPDSFTLGDHPYGWTGFAMAGPFRGLSMLNNNVHGMNSDKFADVEAFHQLHGIDRERYIGTLLQNAADAGYRFEPDSEESPYEFFARVNPTENSPVTNNAVALPTYPLASFATPNGLWIGTPGHKVWEEVNAMSAFQQSLIPPRPPDTLSTTAIVQGRRVFLEAGCQSCHSGPAFTSNRIIPAEEIGTEPVRARAFEDYEQILVSPVAYSFNVDIPVPAGTGRIDIPMDRIDMEQIHLAWAIGGTDGGYKVKGLLGLYWTAPYLHDGGVAVGQDPETQLGLPGTLFSGRPADPFNSLTALVDRNMREEVLEANYEMPGLQQVNIHGTGHEFWVDEENGFSAAEQENLILYLLHLEWDEEN